MLVGSCLQTEGSHQGRKHRAGGGPWSRRDKSKSILVRIGGEVGMECAALVSACTGSAGNKAGQPQR